MRDGAAQYAQRDALSIDTGAAGGMIAVDQPQPLQRDADGALSVDHPSCAFRIQRRRIERRIPRRKVGVVPATQRHALGDVGHLPQPGARNRAGVHVGGDLDHVAGVGSIQRALDVSVRTTLGTDTQFALRRSRRRLSQKSQQEQQQYPASDHTQCHHEPISLFRHRSPPLLKICKSTKSTASQI